MGSSQVTGDLGSADPASLVDPLVGTAGDGQTFPATGVPFAMTQWTPETRPGQQKCAAPFYAADKRLTGLRGSHFLSGSCTQDYGSITLLPLAPQAPVSDASLATLGYERVHEVLHPWFYAVDLPQAGVHAEMTATARAGLLRFLYTSPGVPRLLLRLNTGPASRPGDTTLTLDRGHGRLIVSSRVRRLYAGQGKSAGFRAWFVAQFDRPIASASITQHGRAAILTFASASPHAWLQVRIGSSFTGTQGVRRNLAAELPVRDFTSPFAPADFAAVAASAHQQWNDALGRIRIDGHAPERRIFYTALYHSMLLPRIFSDVDGAYPRFAGHGQIVHARGFTYYCDFSLWDTFRAVHPLFLLLDPARERDMVRSLLAKGAQGGFLPIFPAWNSYTSEMIGDHADAMIGDAWAKNLGGFDAALAYSLMRRNATRTPSAALYRDGRGRRALASYLRYGYIPVEDKVPFAFHPAEQVSRSLEYAYDDWNIARVAAALGHSQDAARFRLRSAKWRLLLDPQTRFIRPRHADGRWQSPFDPAAPDPAFTEGVSWQYTFFVPQDLDSLVQALGGPQSFAARLDQLFARGLYDHGNEPSHSLAYLYDIADQPAKTQQQVRQILDGRYRLAPAGLAGNDDAGQMSAWYVFSALGFYPVTPGSTRYWIGSPRFDSITLLLANSHRLHISAAGAEAGHCYIRDITLNGVPLQRFWLEHSELLAGGELTFTMSADPPLPAHPMPAATPFTPSPRDPSPPKR